MLRAIQVQIDANGQVRPIEPNEHVPAGRALVVLLDSDTNEPALLAESSLAADWLRPEEDEAWAHLQPDK
ncbi:MAG: hypothetical protein GC168_20035 [Candidatus Hydrogenedens sp.]|nr:hypothetical protein [Candidatus Hydrogenedens sp.]